jgi:hypothetical protein
MNTAADFLADPPSRPAPAPAPAPIASWYAQGISDGIGDRLLMFDNTAAASLELLRFRPTLANAPGFERTLRDAVQRLASFRHPAFTEARSLQRLEGDDGLALISTHIVGKRLSDLFRRTDRHAGMHPAFATWLIRQLTSALADLHAQGDNVAHGALTADRIVLTPDRRLVMVEHVLGAALDERRFSPERLWHDVGIVSVRSGGDGPRLDSRSDIVQLGLVALSVLLGRRVTPDEYPRNLDTLINEFVETSGKRSPALVEPLQRWLVEALDPAAGFETAVAAGESLSVLGHPGERIAIGAAPIIEHLHPSPLDAVVTAEAQVTDMAPISSIGNTESLTRPTLWAEAAPPPRSSLVRNAAIGFAVLALVEGVVISRLVGRATPAPVAIANVPLTIDSPTAGDRVIVDGHEVGVTPFELDASSAAHSIRVVARPVAVAPPPAPVAVPPAPSETPTASAIAAAVQRQRSGGLRLTTPIEIQVLEGERVLGSSVDGPIVASAGVHQLDFINTAIGFRSRQTVTIKAGEIIPMRVQPPDGRVSINAQPWAQVWIDGNLVGDTPLANVMVAAGEHEIIFRHPQLGERREKTIVKSGMQTRISANLAK